MQSRIVQTDAPAPPKIEARFGCSATWREGRFLDGYTQWEIRGIYRLVQINRNKRIRAFRVFRPEGSAPVTLSFFLSSFLFLFAERTFSRLRRVNLINGHEMPLGFGRGNIPYI